MAANPRADGWTVERQLAFLASLAHTRSVTAAARAAGMSRESAHRLRTRDPRGLFAALWDAALAPPPAREGHDPPLTDGRLARLLGACFRRQSNGLAAPGNKWAGPPPTNRARTS